MRAKNLDITLHLPMLGEEPDDLNRTEIFILAEDCSVRAGWPRGLHEYFTPIDFSTIETSEQILLKIPSGELYGKVARIVEENGGYTITLEAATWEGLAGGLAGGASGIGPFEIENARDAVVVESSTLRHHAEESYLRYEQVRNICTHCMHKTATMRAILDLLRADDARKEETWVVLTPRRQAEAHAEAEALIHTGGRQ